MDLSELDMKTEFEKYSKAAPKHRATILGKDLIYRYYKNESPAATATILTLAGGTGLGDGFFILANSFMERYSFICFNYPMGFADNESLSDAIAELIKHIGAKNVYLWGQSYGGLIAQITAKRHPEAVSGLILTSTASLSNNIRFEGMKCLVGMISEEKEKKNIRTSKMLPMPLLPAFMNIAFKKHLKNDPAALNVVRGMIEHVRKDMTNEYFAHMDHLLGDLRNHLGTHYKEDFAYLDGRVLIIEPDDDNTFTPDIKDALIEIMPSPTVVRDVVGGHLAMLFDTEKYIGIINDFMEAQKKE